MGFKSFLVALVLAFFFGLISMLAVLLAVSIIATLVQLLASAQVYLPPIILLSLFSITGIALTFGFYSFSPKYLSELKTSTWKKLFFSAIYLVSYALMVLMVLLSTAVTA